jgi:hypothetical protein
MSEVVGRVGRVTGEVRRGAIGEVMVPIRGGTEAFHAQAVDDEAYPIGTRIVVVEYHPPRTVVVMRA